MSEAKLSVVEEDSRENLSLCWRDLRYRQFYKVVDQLVLEVQAHKWLKTGQVRRKLKGNQLAKLHYSIECLVRDCMAVVLQRKKKGEAAIRKGQYYYSSNRPNKMLTYSIHIERAFEGLVELGYLEVTKLGYFDRAGRKDGTSTSRLTRYIASDRLLSLFTIEEVESIPALLAPFKDPELIRVRIKERDAYGVNRKRSIILKETPETLQMRENLIIINNALSRYWYDIEIPDKELSDLQRRLANDPENGRIIRMDQRSLHRVFNDPELLTGGRFYGGWWQNIPKEYRRRLVVNGKQMVELDYSNQHPSILYAQERVIRPADCYTDVIQLNNLSQGAMAADVRKMVKAAFNAMLNSSKPLKQAPYGVQPGRFGLKWADVSEAIIAFHEPIAHHFYTGVGLRLQRLDSDIAEKVLLHFAQNGIAILPLHDSFMMHHGYEASLDQAMHQAFEDVIGLIPTVERKAPAKRTTEDYDCSADATWPHPPVDLVKMFASRAGHDRRLDGFYSLH